LYMASVWMPFEKKTGVLTAELILLPLGSKSSAVIMAL